MNIGNNWSRLRSPDMINFPKRLVDQKKGTESRGQKTPSDHLWMSFHTVWGLYVGYVLGFTGAQSQGKTLVELNKNLQEAVDNVA